MSDRVTQKDIARKLGISVTLVSRALAGKGAEIGAAAATVESIQKAARDAGYVPNATARILKGAPSRTLGVVVYDFEDPFLGAITGMLHRLAHAQDYTLLLAGFEHRRVDAAALRPLSTHSLDGLIVVGSDRNDDWLDVFRARGLRVARIGSGPTPCQPTVAIDDADGIRAVLRHLSQRGYRSAGFLGDPHPVHQARLAEFRKGCSEFGILTRAGWQVTSSETATAAGRQAVRALVEGGRTKVPRALVAASDAIAMGALRTLQELRIRVPDDVALSGFDGMAFADTLTPSLTTVRQPIEAMVQAAFDGLCGPEAACGAATTLRLRGELVVREST